MLGEPWSDTAEHVELKSLLKDSTYPDPNLAELPLATGIDLERAKTRMFRRSVTFLQVFAAIGWIIRCLLLLGLLSLGYKEIWVDRRGFNSLAVPYIARTDVLDPYFKVAFYEYGGAQYFTPLTEIAATLHLPSQIHFDGPSPAVVISLNSSASVTAVSAVLAEYDAKDDVYSNYFFDIVILYSPHPVAVPANTIHYLFLQGAQSILLCGGLTTSVDHIALFKTSRADILSAGPYLVLHSASHITLHPVCRLEVDRYRTFVSGIYPEDGGFEVLGKVSKEFGDVLVPLPSRLYTLYSGKPLAGLRMAVKDLFDIKGIQTAAGSRVYAELYPVATANAPSIQTLLDLGVTIIGKTKSGQFASGASTNDGTLEVQYPFSPRADLWQTCAGSSSGSSCAVAAYDWLDFALGTDTGGSVRLPAAVSGLYGNRPTSGLIPLDGVVPLAPTFDTLGVIARDPKLWTNVLRHWYKEGNADVKVYHEFPKSLIYLTDHISHGSSEGRALKETFIRQLELKYGMQRVEVDFSTKSVKSGYNASQLNTAYEQIYSWYQYENVAKDLLTKYAAVNEGRYPPFDTARRGHFRSWRLETNLKLYNQSLAIINEYRNWFNTDFFQSDHDSCSDSIVISDIGTGGLPWYREDILNKELKGHRPFAEPRNHTWIHQNDIAALAGCVELTLPIGQAAYTSSVSLITEFHPVTINLMTKAGCDSMLFDMVDELAEAGLICTVKTGRAAF